MTYPIEKIWSRGVQVPSGCVEYQGYKTDGGYGRYNGTYIHRILYEHATGDKLSKGEIVMHTCDNPPCCNISHLRKGTKANNSADMATKDRSAHGQKCGHAVLTSDQVHEIRHDSRSQYKIAEEYGVTQPTISRIINYKTWTRGTPK